MNLQDRINHFLDGGPHAVVGASRDRNKYGNRVLRSYLQNNRAVFPINPNADEVESLMAYADLQSLPEAVHGISIITPPHVTEQIIESAGQLGIENVWMQPGAENAASVDRAHELGMNVIPGDACLLVVFGYRD